MELAGEEKELEVTFEGGQGINSVLYASCTLGKNVRGGFVVAVPITKQAPGVRQIRA